MALTVHRFPIKPGAFTLDLPDSAKVVAVQTKDGEPNMWVLLDPEQQRAPWRFHAVATGAPLPDDVFGTHLGTFQVSSAIGTLVFHLFS